MQSDDQQGKENFAPPEDSEQSGENAQSDSETEETNNATLELSSLSDGTYQGEGEGFRGTTSVSVTVESGKITDITVISYEDDEQFFVRAEESIIDDIINTQSLDVSCVSGATFSSNGILEAVANALNVDFENPNQNNSDRGGHGKGNFEKRRH